MISVKYGPGGKPKQLNVNWWAPTQKQWAPILLQENRKYWAAETDASGRPWAALTPKYKAWKVATVGGLPILILTGAMLNSAKVKPQGEGFAVDSTFYGRYHQFGTSKMVARPWMGVPESAMHRLPALSWSNILSKKK
jgi:hypothetical protein